MWLQALPTILLIVADDIGSETLASASTPNIDRLAANGVSFTNCWSSSVCGPSRGMLMTGRFPFRTGYGSHLGSPLPLAEVTLPELLGGGNAFGKWHLGNANVHPNQSGFAHFAGSLGNVHDYFAWGKVVNGFSLASTVYATEDVVNEALAHPADFLYVSFHVAHRPIHEPPGYVGASVDHMVAKMDDEIGRLLSAYPAALVIFVGDNGPLLPAAGKGTMYESGIRVPLIVSAPGISRAECHALVNLTDVFATLAEVRGLPSAAEDSISLVPYLRDPDRPSLRTYNYTEQFFPNGPGPYVRRNQAVRDRRYKLIRNLDGERFFDLAADPEELDPLPLAGPDYLELVDAIRDTLQ